MLLEDIPGYREEIEKARSLEAELRERAFLGVRREVCGVDVCDITPRRLSYLLAVDCAFISGGRISPEDVALFLWVLSPKFKPGSKWRRWLFVRGLRSLPFERCVREICEFVDDQFMDSPSGGGGEAYVSFQASLVNVVASEYGWSERAVMDCPIPRLYQYLRAIQRNHDPRAILFNHRADRARANAIRKYHEMKKEGK